MKNTNFPLINNITYKNTFVKQMFNKINFDKVFIDNIKKYAYNEHMNSYSYVHKKGGIYGRGF